MAMPVSTRCCTVRSQISSVWSPIHDHQMNESGRSASTTAPGVMRRRSEGRHVRGAVGVGVARGDVIASTVTTPSGRPSASTTVAAWSWVNNASSAERSDIEAVRTSSSVGVPVDAAAIAASLRGVYWVERRRGPPGAGRAAATCGPRPGTARRTRSAGRPSNSVGTAYGARRPPCSGRPRARSPTSIASSMSCVTKTMVVPSRSAGP